MERYFNIPEIFQYRIIDTDIIPFLPEVTEMCRDNLCGRYGRSWTCPPAIDPTKLQKEIKSYKNACVFTCKHEIEDSFDFEGMMDAQRATMDVLWDVVARLERDGVKFKALGCGSCTLCEKCTYPDPPCRFPNRALPSLEACGLSVVKLAKLTGINYTNGANTVTYFCMILW